VHILIVPDRPIPSLDALGEDDQALAGKLLATAARLARREGLAADGYRLIVNAGEHGGQEIPHLHLHLLGGRPLGPMLAR
jgi:histidine triad (HIT) family protein